MLKTKKIYVFIVSNILAVTLFLIVSRFILPPITEGIERAYFIILEFVLLLFSLTIMSAGAVALNAKLEREFSFLPITIYKKVISFDNFYMTHSLA